MDAFNSIAERHGISLIEDNAHGFGGTYRGKSLGTFGALATQSFHETKNVQCGEGGALVINDMSLHARAEIIRDKGTNRGDFLRGVVGRYRWMDIGSSYLPSEILATFLTAQLEPCRSPAGARSASGRFPARPARSIISRGGLTSRAARYSCSAPNAAATAMSGASSSSRTADRAPSNNSMVSIASSSALRTRTSASGVPVKSMEHLKRRRPVLGVNW